MPYAIIVGTDEIKEGVVTVKEQRWQVTDGVKSKKQDMNRGVVVKRDELVSWLKNQEILRNWNSGKLIQ